MEPSTFPPGWYPDPVAGAPAGQHRYFTGTIWTEHVANPNASAPVTARKRRRWVGPTLTAIGLALVVCVGGYFISRPMCQPVVHLHSAPIRSWFEFDPDSSGDKRKIEERHGVRIGKALHHGDKLHAER